LSNNNNEQQKADLTVKNNKLLALHKLCEMYKLEIANKNRQLEKNFNNVKIMNESAITLLGKQLAGIVAEKRQLELENKTINATLAKKNSVRQKLIEDNEKLQIENLKKQATFKEHQADIDKLRTKIQLLTQRISTITKQQTDNAQKFNASKLQCDKLMNDIEQLNVEHGRQLETINNEKESLKEKLRQCKFDDNHHQIMANSDSVSFREESFAMISEINKLKELNATLNASLKTLTTEQIVRFGRLPEEEAAEIIVKLENNIKNTINQRLEFWAF
jgi:DNA repair exonuclease SbcCD ATPase subunit